MEWECFSSKGPGELEIIDGRMNGRMYRGILEKKTSSNPLFRWDMVAILCFKMTMIPNIQSSSPKNGFKIGKLGFFLGLANLQTSTPLKICGNC